MSEVKTPAEKVIAAFGGIRATSRAVGRSHAQVSRWRMSRASGGLSGRVPASVMPAIIACIARGDVDGLTAEDLIETEQPPELSMLRIPVSRAYYDQIKNDGAGCVLRLANDTWKRRLEGRDYQGVIVTPLRQGSTEFMQFPWAGFSEVTATCEHVSATPAKMFAITLQRG